MANRYATQGALIVEQLKRRPLTYAEMLALGVSSCPWRRVDEWLSRTLEWQLRKGTKAVGRRVLTTWRVVRNNA